jgi:hypothetical protein
MIPRARSRSLRMSMPPHKVPVIPPNSKTPPGYEFKSFLRILPLINDAELLLVLKTFSNIFGVKFMSALSMNASLACAMMSIVNV